VTDEGETLPSAGRCAGFKCGTGNAHHLVNRRQSDMVYLEIEDCNADDSAIYPADDLIIAKSATGTSRVLLHRKGTPC
jgi:uncharacterized cupin superfamily protein